MRWISGHKESFNLYPTPYFYFHAVRRRREEFSIDSNKQPAATISALSEVKGQDHVTFVQQLGSTGYIVVVNLHTKSVGCSFSRSRDTEKVPKFKSRSRDLGHARFVPQLG